MSKREREKTIRRRAARSEQPARAHAHALKMSPRKVRAVSHNLVGLDVGSALSALAFTPRAPAKPLRKLIESAIANASHADRGVDVDTLVVARIDVDGGPTARRWLTRSQGRTTRIRKRTSHVTVWLTPQAEGR